MAEDLTFRINPEDQAASIDLFFKAIEDIRRLLRDVDYVVHQGTAKRRWIIRELHSSAPAITVQPVLGDQESMDAVADGIRAVTTGTDQAPAYFNEKVLEDLRRMSRLFAGRDRARSIDVYVDNLRAATIEKDISDKASRILAAGYWTLGAVEGTLEAINLHGRPTFTVWDRISRAPVRCLFPNTQDWKDQATASLEKRVLIRGRIRYFSNGIPRIATNIDAMEETTPDPSLPMAYFGSTGAVEGTLEAINLHGRPTFTVWDRISRAPVRCLFPNTQDWKDQATASLEKRVLIRGRIRYFSNGIPRIATNIDAMEETTPDPSLPMAYFGSIPDTEAAQDPVAFLRAIRGLESSI